MCDLVENRDKFSSKWMNFSKLSEKFDFEFKLTNSKAVSVVGKSSNEANFISNSDRILWASSILFIVTSNDFNLKKLEKCKSYF